MAIDRQAWKRVVEQAKTYKELLSSVKKNLILNSYIIPVTLSSFLDDGSVRAETCRR